MHTRKQLSLFLEEPESKLIEEIRAKYNPIQFALIPAHVTLCREDELFDMNTIFQNLKQLTEFPLQIDFGELIRFDNNKGLMLPGSGENIRFQNLRKIILNNVISEPRLHVPHLTLMHPRNSQCTDEVYKEISSISFPHRIQFSSIYLISQTNGKKWIEVGHFNLKSIHE